MFEAYGTQLTLCTKSYSLDRTRGTATPATTKVEDAEGGSEEERGRVDLEKGYTGREPHVSEDTIVDSSGGPGEDRRSIGVAKEKEKNN